MTDFVSSKYDVISRHLAYFGINLTVTVTDRSFECEGEEHEDSLSDSPLLHWAGRDRSTADESYAACRPAHGGFSAQAKGQFSRGLRFGLQTKLETVSAN